MEAGAATCHKMSRTNYSDNLDGINTNNIDDGRTYRIKLVWFGFHFFTTHSILMQKRRRVRDIRYNTSNSGMDTTFDLNKI